MSQKIKHSKIKNTGLLFEILTRQVTADILNNKKSKSVNLLKKYFNENTALGKEKELYDILLTNSYQEESRAEKLLEAVIKTRQRISNKKLKVEKYNLIKEISETFSAKDFFNTRVSNYKTLASIFKFIGLKFSKLLFIDSFGLASLVILILPFTISFMLVFSKIGLGI